MGWCGGTEIFDMIFETLFYGPSNFKETLKSVIEKLEDMDWDCQDESKYWDYPILQEAIKELHDKYKKL